MRYLLYLSLLISLVGNAWLLFMPRISADDLNKDIQNVQQNIEEAKMEVIPYQKGGLIFLSLQLRLDTLKTTLAILEQKKHSILKGINLNFSVDGKSIKPANTETLVSIEREIQNMKQSLEQEKRQADQASGGLIGMMHLVTVATNQNTLAMLEQKYYAMKYGIPYIQSGTDPGKTEKQAPGKVVPDKDAL